MKRILPFMLTLVMVFLCACEESESTANKETSVKIGKKYYVFEPETEHPGVVEMDAHYVMVAKDKRNRELSAENIVINCDNKNIKINGNILTIPYTVRSSGEKLKVSMYDKEHPNRTGEFTFDFDVQFTDKPTFKDDFNTLNSNIWKDDFYPDRMPVEQLNCENGELVMFADTDTKEIELSTTGTFNQSYGSFSARIKMPKSGLSNVAFWLCTEAGVKYLKNVQRPSESGGEIDVVEYFPTWGPNKTSCSVHWNGWSTYHSYVTEEPEVEQTLSGEWHIYSCVWTSTAVYFYLDDQHISTYTGDGVGPDAGPMQILIQHSNPKKDDVWGGKYNPEELPNESRWDYVRVYGLVSE